jgi:hypothetical protein
MSGRSKKSRRSWTREKRSPPNEDRLLDLMAKLVEDFEAKAYSLEWLM